MLKKKPWGHTTHMHTNTFVWIKNGLFEKVNKRDHFQITWKKSLSVRTTPSKTSYCSTMRSVITKLKAAGAKESSAEIPPCPVPPNLRLLTSYLPAPACNWGPVSEFSWLSKPNYTISILKSKKISHQTFHLTSIYSSVIFCAILKYVLGFFDTIHQEFLFFSAFKMLVSSPWSKVEVKTTFSKSCLLLRISDKNNMISFYSHLTLGFWKCPHFFSKDKLWESYSLV